MNIQRKIKIHTVIRVFEFKKETDGVCMVICGSCSNYRSFNMDMMYRKLCVATIHAIVFMSQVVQ